VVAFKSVSLLRGSGYKVSNSYYNVKGFYVLTF